MAQLAALSLALTASASDPACRGCNLIIISITNVGADHMSLYGYGRKTTPGLDAWASGALVFEDFFSPASWTLPVATTLFTGLSPDAHMVTGRHREDLLSKDVRTLPEVLSAAGYRTAAFTGGLDYMPSFGHMRGFVTAPANPPFTKSAVTVPQASRWLAENGSGKFFLLVHSYDAHPPFLPPAEYEGTFSSSSRRGAMVDPTKTYRGYREGEGDDISACYHVAKPPVASATSRPKAEEVRVTLKKADVDYLRDLYDETILGEDKRVGEFLAALPAELLERTVVVVLSEHGEMFAKHGRFGRAGGIRGTLYEDVVHVPLLIKIPGVQARRVRGLAQAQDVMPTLLEILGAAPVPGMQGASLLPLVSSGTAVNDYVYGGARYNSYMPETYAAYSFPSVNEYIRGPRWKLIHEVVFSGGKGGEDAAPEETFELYDIKADPAEAVNLSASRPEIVKELAGRLRQLDQSSRLLGGSVSRHKVPEDVAEKAKQHGYW